MTLWWRAYNEALHDPKLIALSDRLHRAWFNLLCIAAKHGGALPAIAIVAIELRVTVARAAEWITALVTAGLLDEVSPGVFAPHNWNGRQYKSDVSTERVKRFRNGGRNVSRNVSETPPETESTEAETERERKKDAADAASRSPDSPEIDLFRRGKEVLGERAGGIIRQLLAAKGEQIPLARAAIETAATKQNPREYVAGIVKQREAATHVDPRL